MFAGIDHAVILVSDLETAAVAYRRQGFNVELGGRHSTGTQNALVGLADGSYLELLAFYEPRTGSRWWKKLAEGGGLIATSVRTDDLRADVAKMCDAGLAMSEPRKLGRIRPDGYHLRWTVCNAYGEHQDVVPFLIQDETPPNERLPKERAHSNGVIGLDTLTFAVRDPTILACAYAQVIGRIGTNIERADLDAVGVQFVVGAHKLEFLAPTRAGGLTGEWLRTRGPSPMSLTLRSTRGDTCELP